MDIDIDIDLDIAVGIDIELQSYPLVMTNHRKTIGKP